jgi:complement component 1 Q subcomponent-binding protein
MEEDMKEDDDLSTNIKEYLENSPFEVCPPPSTPTPSNPL